MEKINKYIPAIILVLLIAFIFSSEKDKKTENYKQERINELEQELENYKKINPEKISEYFTNKYKKEHEKIDSNDIAADIIYLQNLLAD